MQSADALLLRPVLCAVQGVPAPGLAYDPAASRGWGAFVPEKGGGGGGEDQARGAGRAAAPSTPTPTTSRPARLLARRLAEVGWLHRAVRAEAERPARAGEGAAVRAARAALRGELAPLADALAGLLEGEAGRRGGGGGDGGGAPPPPRSLRAALPALAPLAARLEELAAAATLIGGGRVTGGALAAALAARAAAGGGAGRAAGGAGCGAGGALPAGRAAPAEQLTPTPGPATARLAAAAAAPALARTVAWALDGRLEAEEEGEVGDGGGGRRRAGDFFVVATPPGTAASGGGGGGGDGDGLWRSAHAVDAAALPPFAPPARPAVAADVLAAGRAVAFLVAGGCGPGAAAAWAASAPRARLAATALTLRPDDVDGVAAWASAAAAAAGEAAAAALLGGGGGRAALRAVWSYALAGGPAGSAFAPAFLAALGPSLRARAGAVSELSLDAALGDALAACGGPPDGCVWAGGGGGGGGGGRGGLDAGDAPSPSSAVPAARLRIRLDRRLVAAAATAAGGGGGPAAAPAPQHRPPPTGWDAATLRVEASRPVSALLPPGALEVVADAGRVVWALARAGAALGAAAADLAAAGRAAAALGAAARAARRAAVGSGGGRPGASAGRHRPARCARPPAAPTPPPRPEPAGLWAELAALGSLRLSMAAVVGAARAGAGGAGVDAAFGPLLAGLEGGEGDARAAAASTGGGGGGGGLDALLGAADAAVGALASRLLVRRGVAGDAAASAALDAWLAAVRGLAAPARALARASAAAAGRAADGCGWGDEGAWAEWGGGEGSPRRGPPPPPPALDPCLEAELGAVSRARSALAAAHRARLAAWVAALPEHVRAGRGGGEGGGGGGGGASAVGSGGGEAAGAAFAGVAALAGL